MGRPLDDGLTVGEFVQWMASQPERAAQRLLDVGTSVAQELRWTDVAGEDAVADLSTLVFVRQKLSVGAVRPTILLADWVRGVLVRLKHRARVHGAREHERITRARAAARKEAQARVATAAHPAGVEANLESQLATLTPKQREVVEMTAAGHGVRAIAGLLGIDRSSVRERLERARRAVRAATRGGEGPAALAGSAGRAECVAPPLPTALDRRVWRLRTGGQTIRQIASVIGATPAAVRSRLQRLRRKIPGCDGGHRRISDGHGRSLPRGGATHRPLDDVAGLGR